MKIPRRRKTGLSFDKTTFQSCPGGLGQRTSLYFWKVLNAVGFAVLTQTFAWKWWRQSRWEEGESDMTERTRQVVPASVGRWVRVPQAAPESSLSASIQSAERWHLPLQWTQHLKRGMEIQLWMKRCTQLFTWCRLKIRLHHDQSLFSQFTSFDNSSKLIWINQKLYVSSEKTILFQLIFIFTPL